MARTVMIFGLGAVGEVALQILARSDGIDRIVASSRSEALGLFKTNTEALGAMYQQSSKRFEFRQNDINDTEATARLLEEIKPLRSTGRQRSSMVLRRSWTTAPSSTPTEPTA